MREDNTMKCHPPRPPLWHWLAIIGLSVAFPGALIFAALVIASELVTNYQTPGAIKGCFAVVSSLLGVGLMFLFLRWEQDRWYWVLEADRLIGGKKRDKIFPLPSVVKIVPGLPDRTNPLVAANKFVHPDLWATVIAERKLALLLKFADGSFMPFHVHRCVNGCPLMTGLVKRLEYRIDRDYAYTRKEIRALRSADWNRVVKQQVP